MVDNFNLMFTLQVFCRLSIVDCTGGFMADSRSEYYIPDNNIQASSAYSSYFNTYKARDGRLHGSLYWSPTYADNQPWIQADLGRLVNVFGIQSQGGAGYYWTTTLKVSTFLNVPGIGDVGDFITEGVDVKVCT